MAEGNLKNRKKEKKETETEEVKKEVKKEVQKEKVTQVKKESCKCESGCCVSSLIMCIIVAALAYLAYFQVNK